MVDVISCLEVVCFECTLKMFFKKISNDPEGFRGIPSEGCYMWQLFKAFSIPIA